MTTTTDNFSAIGFQVMDMELSKKHNMIDNFIYSCSHGIRSPLKTMEGLVRLMKMYPVTDTSDWKNYLLLLEQSANRMQSILEHFQLLRANAEQKVVGEEIDPAEFAADLLGRLNSRTKQFGITTHVHINNRGMLATDRWRLETVVKLLLDNAIAFHDFAKTKREIALFITVSSSSCSIQLHDNGIGIPESEQTKIFNLFYRGSARSSGAGMGLFIVGQMIEKLKGSMSIMSSEGIGSVFSLWLPNLLSR